MMRRAMTGIQASAVVLTSALAIAGGLAVPASATSRSSARLHYSWAVDAPVLAGSVAALVLGNAISTATVPVPPGGLDPAGIHWQIDRNSLHDIDETAATRSNTLLKVSLVLPVALGLATAAPGNHWRAAGDRAALWAESAGVTQGLTTLLKNSVSRPRPFTYQDEAQRPDDSIYDVEDDRAFRSMPSGHASTAWCGAALLWMDPWLEAPDATWKRRAAVSFAGATIAMATGALRVEAGQHFPTDVAAGAAIGAASGTLVPLLHGYTDHGHAVPRPTARHWLDRAAGVAAGIGVGALLSEALGGH